MNGKAKYSLKRTFKRGWMANFNPIKIIGFFLFVLGFYSLVEPSSVPNYIIFSIPIIPFVLIILGFLLLFRS